MIENILLYLIQPNPFQTRHREDLEHVENLAKSIKEQGMLQIPSARENPDGGGNFQLVFGHSRFAAYQKLRDDTDGNEYCEMPLNIVELDDQGMFEQAVAENRERKDLTAIEEAQAMAVYRDHFKKTSAQIGELFHLSDSAVRNKMRLLDLPDDVKAKISDRTMTEGAGRELLTFLDLPAEVQKDISRYHHTGFVKHAIDGGSPESLHEMVTDGIQRVGREMDKKLWKHTDEFQGEKIVGICKGCAFLQKRDDHDYCLNPECFNAKRVAWQQQYLEKASLLSGIPVLEADKDNYYDINTFAFGGEARLEKIREARCENLRLKYDTYDHGSKVTHLVDDGFLHAQIVCSKRQGFCTCRKAMDAGLMVEAGEDGAALAREDLKEINRQIRAQQKYNRQVKQDLINQATYAVLAGLENNVQKVWEAIFGKVAGYSHEGPDGEIRTKIEQGDANLADVKFGLAYSLADSTWYDEPKEVLKQLNENLVKLGLDPLDISFGEDPTQTLPKTDDLEREQEGR